MGDLAASSFQLLLTVLKAAFLKSAGVLVATNALSYNQTPFLIQNKSSK
jgi:hypothetical protein